MNEFNYPIYKKSNWDSAIIKFINLDQGVVIIQGRKNTSTSVGSLISYWMPHTNADKWQDLTPLELTLVKQKEKELKL